MAERPNNRALSGRGLNGAQPQHPSDLYAIGLAHAVEGRLDRAVTALSAALVQEPGNAEGHNNLGLVLQRLGRLDDAMACFQRALAIRPAYVIALTNLGAALLAAGRHEDAAGYFEAALEHEPTHLAALNNLGSALHALGRLDEAIERLRTAIALDADFVEARINLGDVLYDCDRHAEAIICYEAALGLRTEDLGVRLKLAVAFHKLGRHDEAISHFKRSSETDPNCDEADAGLGRVLQEVGQIDAARAAFRRAIAANPRRLAYYLNLAHITKLEPDDPAFLAMLDLARDSQLSDDDRINAHFGLGKALADVGRHQESFDHFLAGSAAKRRSVDYDEADALRGLQRMKDVFSPAKLARWPRQGSPSATPIFIVGMPRSGSTLVEQILANHPHVAAGGETAALRESLRRYGGEAEEWRYPAPAFVPTQAQITDVARLYLERLVEVAAPTPSGHAPDRITDKMLSNFRHIGLITRLFPNARIIHTFRDPIETCLSCFSINFADQPFTFDLGELGRHYRGYAQLMRHWRMTLPQGTVFDVRYEAVVQDLEGCARAILHHCGLDWNDDCLRFYEAERPVRTASVEQVRRPIYASSIRRWRPDSETLRPLLNGLGSPSSAT